MSVIFLNSGIFVKEGETVLVSWWFLHFNSFADTYFKEKKCQIFKLKK